MSDTKMAAGRREVPVSAMRLGVGEFKLADNGDGAKSAPLHLVALGGQPIQSWYWGRCVHDLSGMRMAKPRITVDYVHDPYEVLGYVNKFSIESGSLELDGALTPYGDKDRATEVISKSKAGVPYESSIDFTPSLPDDLVVEFVPEEASVEVNGSVQPGPIVVFRQWVLRGVAICPYGADRETSSTVQSKGEVVSIDVQVMQGKPEASKNEKAVSEKTSVELVQAKPEAVEAPATQQAAPAAATPEAVVQAEPKVETEDKPVEAPVEATQMAAPAAVEGEPNKPEPVQVDPRAEFKQFIAEFGQPEGAAYFAEGLSIEAARDKHAQAIKTERDVLKVENESLKARLAEKPQAAPFDPATDASDPIRQLAAIKDPRKKAEFFREHFGGKS